MDNLLDQYVPNKLFLILNLFYSAVISKHIFISDINNFNKNKRNQST